MLLVTIYFFIELLYIQLFISKSTTSTTKTLSNDVDSLVILDILLLADGLMYFLLFMCYHRLIE